MELLGKADTTATIYMAMLPPPEASAQMNAALSQGGTEKLVGAYLSIVLKGGLDVNGGARFGSEADAKSIQDKLQKGLEEGKKDPQAGAFLSNVTLGTAGSDVTLKVSLTEAQLDQLVEMLKQVLPMLMMMGGQ